MIFQEKHAAEFIDEIAENLPNLEVFIYEGKSTLEDPVRPFNFGVLRSKEKKFLRLKRLFFEFEAEIRQAFLYFMLPFRQIAPQMIANFERPRQINEFRRRFEEAAKCYFAFKCPNLQIEMHHKCENRENDGKNVDHFVIWSNTTYRSETSKDCGF